jgi:hypothetical protein
MEETAPSPLPQLRPWQRWLAPGILAGVACAQLAAAHLGPLSPWKGGGFGMFSTVDGPGMRTLQAEGIDEEGNILRLDVLGSLNGDLPEKLQAFPNLHDLGPMGAGLLEQEWVAVDAEEQYLKAAERGEKSPEPAAGNLPGLPGLAPAVLPPTVEKVAEGEEPPMYRTRGPADLPGIPSRYLRSVRLRWWKMRWDEGKTRLFLEPLGREVRVGAPGWPDERP